MSRPKYVTLTPDALDRNGISTSYTPVAARLDFLIDGALSTGYDRNGISVAATPSGTTPLTLGGATGTSYRARGGAYIAIYAAADDSGRTFTVTGKDVNHLTITEAITGPGLGLSVIGATRFYEITSIAADATCAGDIEVGPNGYIEFTTPQHISTYGAADESGETMTFLGEDRYGNALTETDVGPTAGATVTALKNFKKIYKISIGTASTGAMEIGVNGTCESQWLGLDWRNRNNFNVGLGVKFSSGGAMTYTVQHTFDDLNASGFVEAGAATHNHDTLVALTAANDGNYTNPPTAIRLAITAHTGGTATIAIIQAG